MVNPFREVNWQPGLKERRKFATSLVVGFPCVAAALLLTFRWRGAGGSWGVPLVVGGVGVAVGLILWVVPQIARPFYVGWYGVACCLGFLIGNMVVAGIYLVMFAPVGLAMRAMGRRALSKGFDRNRSSYWRDAPAAHDPERYYRQF